jgi:peroxiredoxin (alkyl hydroperoxide reductase subunit C)
MKGAGMAVLVGKPAPDFTATAVLGDNEIKEITLSSFVKGKYAVVFFYPFDFTFVCPTELIAFDHRLDEFKKRNVEVIGVSIDSEHAHLAWKNTPVEKGGIGPVRYPIVADVRHLLARAYDVESSGGQAFRGSFLIDRSGIVRHQVVNDLPLGRNIDEMLRMVDALQFNEEHGEVCPAGWTKGKAGMKDNAQGVASYLASHAKEL